RKKRSNACGSSSGVSPGPVSSTARRPGSAITRTLPPGGVRRRAFSTRLDAEHPRLLLVPLDGRPRDRGQVDRLAPDAELAPVHPRQVEQVADEPLEA